MYYRDADKHRNGHITFFAISYETYEYIFISNNIGF